MSVAPKDEELGDTSHQHVDTRLDEIALNECYRIILLGIDLFGNQTPSASDHAGMASATAKRLPQRFPKRSSWRRPRVTTPIRRA